MTIPTVTLTSYNMGDATEAEYDAWTSYVCEHIDEHTGFEVAVEVDRFGTAGDDRIVATDEQREAIQAALADLWQSWCADGATVC